MFCLALARLRLHCATIARGEMAISSPAGGVMVHTQCDTYAADWRGLRKKNSDGEKSNRKCGNSHRQRWQTGARDEWAGTGNKVLGRSKMPGVVICFLLIGCARAANDRSKTRPIQAGFFLLDQWKYLTRSASGVVADPASQSGRTSMPSTVQFGPVEIPTAVANPLAAGE